MSGKGIKVQVVCVCVCVCVCVRYEGACKKAKEETPAKMQKDEKRQTSGRKGPAYVSDVEATAPGPGFDPIVCPMLFGGPLLPVT